MARLSAIECVCCRVRQRQAPPVGGHDLDDVADELTCATRRRVRDGQLWLDGFSVAAMIRTASWLFARPGQSGVRPVQNQYASTDTAAAGARRSYAGDAFIHTPSQGQFNRSADSPHAALIRK
jgi:hypothetical protein